MENKKMENKNDIPVTVSNGEYELAQPVKQLAINVSLKNWKKIKDRIKKINCDSPKFSAIASAMWGVASSSFVAMFPFIFPLNTTLLIVTIAIFVVSIISGLALTIASRHEKNIQKTTKEYVLEFMTDIEDSFNLPNIDEE